MQIITTAAFLLKNKNKTKNKANNASGNIAKQHLKISRRVEKLSRIPYPVKISFQNNVT